MAACGKQERGFTRDLQMEVEVQRPDYINDAFISYSRKDREFAAKKIVIFSPEAQPNSYH